MPALENPLHRLKQYAVDEGVRQGVTMAYSLAGLFERDPFLAA
jgi:hypothetical protein